MRPCTGQESARVELATGRRAENLVLALSHDHPYDPGLVRSVRPWSAKPASSSWTSQPGWRWSRQRPPPASPPAWTPGSSTHWPWPVGAGLCASRAGRLGPRSSCTSRTPKPAGPRARPGAPRFRQGPGPPAERARVRGASCTPARGGRVQVQEGRQAGLQPGGAPCCRLPGTGQGLERGHRRPGRSARQRCRRGAEPPDAPLACGAHHKSLVLPAGGGRHRRRAHRGERHLLALPRLRGCGRVLVCTDPARGTVHHRDVAGAQNMVRKLGRAPSLIAHIEHRRVGTPARRDQRRVSYELSSRTTPEVPARTRATTVASAGVESLVAWRRGLA